MKKHLHNSLRALLLSLAVLLSLPMLALEVKIYGINYDLDAEAKQATVIKKSSDKYSGKVVIPESVEHEGTSYSVTSIGVSAFYYCSGLTSVTIPNSVTSIGESAFYNCSGLTSVTIGNGVTSIGDYAFNGCFGLTEMRVDANNSKYDSREGCNAIIETSSNTLISGCQTTVIPNSVTSIGDYAFFSCSGLTSLTIPNSVKSIGHIAFYCCDGLTSVTIGNSVTSIGEGAFTYCSGLTSLTIPNSVKSIGVCAFNHCTGLTEMKVDANNSKYDSREGCNAIIETSSNTLISGCQTTVIPNSVTSIGNSAFSGCSGLTSVTIPNSVTSIDDCAFYACVGLQDVYCYAENVPSTHTDAFYCFDFANITLHVPVGSIESYKTTAPWSSFGKIVGLTPEETGIDELKGENGKVKTALFDLSGRRVQKAQKGVFIQNGKVVVK